MTLAILIFCIVVASSWFSGFACGMWMGLKQAKAALIAKSSCTSPADPTTDKEP